LIWLYIKHGLIDAQKWPFAPLLQLAVFGRNAQLLRTQTLWMQLNQRLSQQWRIATASRHFAISNII
jgi:hypothetical protein